MVYTPNFRDGEIVIPKSLRNSGVVRPWLRGQLSHKESNLDTPIPY